ncbi:hypothetical protein [Kitasatospora sp. NPDC002965]|uniref:hypothetical protein n=1 Tax=unclassified Kitasatospora TaxID=2633591 RepID=UPI0033B2935A
MRELSREFTDEIRENRTTDTNDHRSPGGAPGARMPVFLDLVSGGLMIPDRGGRGIAAHLRELRRGAEGVPAL